MGVIFDFDGVIVDSGKLHELAWQHVANKRSANLTHEQFLAGFGVKNDRFISEILGWTNDADEIAEISRQKEVEFNKNIENKEVEFVPGVEAFIASLQALDIPCAIASSSIPEHIHALLNGSSITMKAIVSGRDVHVGKPNPAVFLQAAQMLKMPPERCVVIEDAILGIEAAKKAGCKCIAITTSFSRTVFENLPYKADAIIDKFSELSIREIQSWFH